MSILMTAKRDFKASEEFLLEAIELFRGLLQDGLDVYIPELANSLYQLYFIKYDKQDYLAAVKPILESMQLYEKLASKHPEVFLPETIEAMKGVSHIYSKIGQMGQAYYYKNKLDQYKKQLETIKRGELE